MAPIMGNHTSAVVRPRRLTAFEECGAYDLKKESVRNQVKALSIFLYGHGNSVLPDGKRQVWEVAYESTTRPQLFYDMIGQSHVQIRHSNTQMVVDCDNHVDSIRAHMILVAKLERGRSPGNQML
jgi:hypothetical protein